MARFRLRFLLQEFDLSGPEVVLGRGPDCQVTIEDPLVSRQHAVIRLADEGAKISDLGSRNGVRVNGHRIQQEIKLRDGDRIRLGTQELVFHVIDRQQRAQRPTGYLRVCASCHTPYPEEAQQCPHCGEEGVPDEEETLSRLHSEGGTRWPQDLLAQGLERALSANRFLDADRLLRRLAAQTEEDQSLDANAVSSLSLLALRFSVLASRPEWIGWIIDLHQRHGVLPSEPLLDALESVATGIPTSARDRISALVEWWHGRHDEKANEGQETLSRLRRLVTLARGG